MRRTVAGILVCAFMLSVTWPVAAAERGSEAPAFSVTFPDEWVVEDIGFAGEPLRPLTGDGDPVITVLARAYPVDRGEECVLIDLHMVAATLSTLGVRDQMTMDRVAVDILDHDGGGTTSSGLGYGEKWSSSFEGSGQNGATYVLYSYLGRDAWPGLEDEWLALDCRSDGHFHQDWRQIAQTFGYEPPPAVETSTGPVVIGGRLEVPSSGFAMVLPDDWVGADLMHPELDSNLQSLSGSTRWFAEALTGPFGQSLDDRAAAGDEVRAWAWLPEDGPFWHRSCEVTVEDSPWESIDELVELGADYVASDPKLSADHAWVKVDLPAGEAARHDFRWSPTAAGSEYHFLDVNRQLTLSCQDTALDDAGMEADRDFWLSIAETFEFLPVEE